MQCAVSVQFQFLGRNSGRSDFVFGGGNLTPQWKFQFLGRNSGRSDLALFCQFNASTSMFQFLGRNSSRSDPAAPHATRRHDEVSIPRSEFWAFGRLRLIGGARRKSSFNSSVGILVVRTQAEALDPRPLGRFNSSVGILVVRTK